MSNAKNFDVDLREEMSRLYDGLAVDQLEKVRKVLYREYKKAIKGMSDAAERRARLDAYSSRTLLTTANAKYATAAEHFERIQKKIDYVNERIDFVHTAIPWNEKPSFDALFDGSNAHLLEHVKENGK